MYIPSVKIKKSPIDGKGVFALKKIAKGAIVWKFNPLHDLQFTQDEFGSLPENKQREILHSAYLSPWTGLWVCPPNGDPACYTNHSNTNNLSVRYDPGVSPEPYFIANQTIKAGDELTNNYNEFDQITRETKPFFTQLR